MWIKSHLQLLQTSGSTDDETHGSDHIFLGRGVYCPFIT